MKFQSIFALSTLAVPALTSPVPGPQAGSGRPPVKKYTGEMLNYVRTSTRDPAFNVYTISCKPDGGWVQNIQDLYDCHASLWSTKRGPHGVKADIDFYPYKGRSFGKFTQTTEAFRTGNDEAINMDKVIMVENIADHLRRSKRVQDEFAGWFLSYQSSPVDVEPYYYIWTDHAVTYQYGAYTGKFIKKIEGIFPQV